MGSDDEIAFAALEFVSPHLRGLVSALWSMTYGASVDALPGIVAPDAHVEFIF